MEQILIQSAQLGGTVFTVVAFLKYLSTRDTKWEKALINNAKANLLLARALQKLTDKMVTTLISVNKNITTTDKNTDVIDKNTDAINKSNGDKS